MSYQQQLLILADQVAALAWYKTGIPVAFDAYLAGPDHRVRAGGGVPRLAFELLAALGLSGWSTRRALTEIVNYYRGIALPEQQRSYKRAFHLLAAHGLWHTQQTSFGHRRAVFVWLTDLGRSLLQTEGLAAVSSEWELIEAGHRRAAEGGQMAHSAAICMFQHHARQRGYLTLACPTGDFGKAEPDSLVELGAQLYVEVQGRGSHPIKRRSKWQNQVTLQGCVAICAQTPRMAARFAEEAQATLRIRRGLITDLATLATEEPVNLWTHCWYSEYMPLEPITEADGAPLFPAQR